MIDKPTPSELDVLSSELAELAVTASGLSTLAVTGTNGKTSTTSMIASIVRAAGPELLFVDWLNALIFEITTRKMLFCRFQVMIDGHNLQATATGEPIDIERHQPAVEIKGATLTELKVFRDSNNLWHAQCVVDV